MTGITAQIGRLETGKQLILNLSTPTHCLLVGSTRSGKSTLNYSLLASLAQYPTVQVWGSDITGILLAPWESDSEHIALDTTDMERHAVVLENAVDEMNRRIKMLRAECLDKLPDPTESLPLIFIQIEEGAGLMDAAANADIGAKTGEKISPRIARAISTLASGSAKVNMRLCISLQRSDSTFLSGFAKSNFLQRILLKQPDQVAVRMTLDDLPDSLASQVPSFAPGVGIINRPDGDEIYQRFRASYIDYKTYRQLTRRKENV